MIRVIVFGNSHVGAWQAAWPEILSSWPNVEVTFFGVPDQIHRRYKIDSDGKFNIENASEKDRERVSRINGCDNIDLTKFDRQVSVGTSWVPEAAVKIVETGDPEMLGHRNGNRPVYSEPFLYSCLAHSVDSIFRSNEIESDGLVNPTFFARPIYAETCKASTHRWYKHWRSTDGYDVSINKMLDIYEKLIVQRFSEAGLCFLAPPKSLRASSGATAQKYLATGGGIVNPEQPARRGDHSHMNNDYGIACLNSYLKSIS